MTGTVPGNALDLAALPTSVALVQGQSTKLTLTLIRGAEQQAPVTISLTGARDGIASDALTIPGDSSTGDLIIKTPLSAPQGAVSGAIELRISGSNSPVSKPLSAFVQGPPGAIDMTWGTNGQLSGYLGTMNTGLADLALSSDDSFYAFGFCHVDTDQSCVVHITADGKVDTSYGGSTGLAPVPMQRPSTLAVDSMGRVLVMGLIPSTIARLTTNGQLDPSFGQSNGIAPFDTSGAAGSLYDLGNLIAADSGDIFLSWDNLNGSDHRAATMHLDASGNLRTGYGTNGVAVKGIGSLVTLGVHRYGPSKNDPYLAWVGNPGTAGTYAAFLGFDAATGGVDANFGSSNPTQLTLASLYSPPQYKLASAELSDGSVIAAFSGTSGYFFRKFDSHGNAVTTFGTQGLAGPFLPIDFPLEMAVQDDGKFIVIFTNTTATGLQDLHFARFTDTGSMDPSFGNNGMVDTMFACNSDARGIVLQKKTHRIIVGNKCKNLDEAHTLTAYWL